MAWYDNEWGYSTRLVELAERMLLPVAGKYLTGSAGEGRMYRSIVVAYDASERRVTRSHWQAF